MNGASHAMFQVSKDISGSASAGWHVGVSIYFRDPAGRDKLWTTYVKDPNRDDAIMEALNAVQNDLRRTALFSIQDWTVFHTAVRGLCGYHNRLTEWNQIDFIWGVGTFFDNARSGPLGSADDPLSVILLLAQPLPPGLSMVPPGQNTLSGHVHTGGITNGQTTSEPDDANAGVDAVDDLLDLVNF